MLRRRAAPLLVLVGLLALPVAAWAGKTSANGTPGMLSIQGGKGTVDLQAYGAVIAQIRKGKVKVKIYKGRHRRDRHSQATVRMRKGKVRHLEGGTTLYDGRNIRIRIVDQKFRLQINGVGIHLSAVAQGQVTLQASPTASDPGTFSLDGTNYQPLPSAATTYQLGSGS